MATVPPPDPKPVYRRAVTTKVRTGCFTWTRRKKCDEAKPACRRCINASFTCEGYPSVFVPAQSKRLVRGNREAYELAIANRINRLLPPPFADLCLDPEPSLGLPDRYFFHHFRTITIPDFVRLVDPRDFWRAHVLPLCLIEPAVLHAAAALGAAHNHYLAYGRAGQGRLEEQFGPACAAIHNYNRSIRKILGRSGASHPAAGSAQDLGALLVCCVLFVCLEDLLGRHKEALRHMRAGAALLTTIDLTTPSHWAPRPIPIPSVADHAALTPLLRASATVLSRFGVDASILQDQQVIPDIHQYTTTPRPLGDPSRPFSSLQDAKDAIWGLDMRMVRLHLDYPEEPNYSNQTTPVSTPDEELRYRSPAWTRLQADFRCWSSKLHYTLAASTHAPTQTPNRELRESLMMRLRHLFWDMIMVDESRLPAVYDETLATVERVYKLEQALSPWPVFTLDCDAIPMVVIIAARDEALIPRVLALLQGHRRREGMWDSAQVANRIEASPRGCLEQMSFPELFA
ncbi:hypothetical protein CC79DRAFT_1056120 [Sarocladium strictum]